MSFSRRDFLATAAAASASLVLAAQGQNQTPSHDHDHDGHQNHAAHDHPKPGRPEGAPRLPAILSKVTGTVGIDAAYDMLKQGRNTLDAALQVTKTQEDNPDDNFAGLGGLPNEDGEVELDASCMHGPTRRIGSIAGVRGIRNASLLARAVMDHAGYAQLVGEGAQRFALAQGFQKEDLLTERTRKVYAVWKKIQANSDLLGTGIFDPSWPEPGRKMFFLPKSQSDLEVLVHKLEPIAVEQGLGPQWTWRAVYDAVFPAAAALFVATVNEKNEMSCVSTSSGLPWRMAGVTSDAAMIGAGGYVDPEVGSAGATGNAEPNIKIAGASLIIENMRKGMSPEDAGMDALRHIAKCYKNDMTALRFVQMVYYILRKDGYYASVSLWHGDPTGHVRQFAIHDGQRRVEECLYLFKGNPAEGCPSCS